MENTRIRLNKSLAILNNNRTNTIIISAAIFILSVLLFGCQRTPTDTTESNDHFQQGQELYNDLRYSSALEEFKLSINADPTNTEAYLKASEILVLKSDYDQAIELLVNGQETVTNPSDVYEKIGEIYYLKKDYNNAKTNLVAALEKDSNSWSVASILFKTYIKLNDINKAQKTFENFSTDDSNANSEKEYYLALITYSNNQTALNHLNQAELEAQGDLLEKISEYKQILVKVEEEPDKEISNLSSIAYILIKNELYNVALPLLNSLAEKDSEYWGTQLYLGIANYGNDNYDEAIKSLMNATTLAQTNYEPWYYLGLCYANKKDQAAMKEAFDNAVAFSSENKETVLYDYTSSLISLEAYSQAVEKYKSLIELGSKQIAKYKIELGYLYLNKLADHEKALLIGKELVEEYQGFESLTNEEKAKSYDIYGWSLIKSKMNDGPKYLNMSIEKDPHLAEAFFHLGLLYLEQGKYTEAKAELEKAVDFDLEGDITPKALVEINKL